MEKPIFDEIENKEEIVEMKINKENELEIIKDDVKSIKQKLKESGYYKDVLDILKNITKETTTRYFVDVFTDCCGNNTFAVNGAEVRDDALNLITMIVKETENDIQIAFNYLDKVISTITSRYLRDYANDLLYNRKPEFHIDTIRSYRILKDIIDYYNVSIIKSFKIPQDWRKTFDNHLFKAGDKVTDKSNDMFGIILDKNPDDTVFIYTNNGCVEEWEEEDLVYTGNSMDISFLMNELNKDSDNSLIEELEDER